MRVVISWRFMVYVALPLLIAMLSTMNLTYDLLRRVESGSNAAEQNRNETVLREALKQEEMDLSRMVAENAQWQDAVTNTSNVPNAIWFEQTLANFLGNGHRYDTVAVLDAETGQILLAKSVYGEVKSAQDILGGKSLNDVLPLLDKNNPRRGVASGYVQAALGPRIVALAPVYLPSSPSTANNRILYFSKQLDSAWTESKERQLQLRGVKLTAGTQSANSQVQLSGLDGQDSLVLSWRNRALGDILTSDAWPQVGAVLGFLIIVMMGVAFVCWRLLQQLMDDESKAQHNAMHDTLTGLPNRAALTAALQNLYDTKQSHALAFADLDGFKEVNDSYGHEFGDRLIYMIANGIRQLADGAALCSRLGGDEFVVMFKGEKACANAVNFSNNLIAMLKHPFDMEGRLASVGASIGIAETDGSLDVSEMLRRSDIAMYRAKSTGKNRHCIFDQSFDAERTENLSIASELRSILVSRNLDVMFQPVVSAKTGEITGVEALARWPSTSIRCISPDKFIGIAENSGLIDGLGELILEKAAFAAAKWPTLRLAVNISAVQLNNPGFVSKALEILERNGIATNRVEFEITETSLINDTDRAKEVFKALQSRGIQVALDDFGTGFSSIGYLRTFQFDRIKIDKSIVSKLLSSTSELAVVQGTLLVARGLSAEVTAEGVESAEEASVLRLAGCSELQGFHYYKPMQAADVTAILQKNKLTRTPRTVVSA